VPLLSYRDEYDVYNRASETLMGLGASFWTNDSVTADRIARQLEAVSAWINDHLQLNPNVPSGGHKESGIGLEAATEGLKSFCNVQALFCMKLSHI